MCDSPDIIDFSQYGQGFPTPSLSWHIPDIQDQQIPVNKEPRARQDCGPASKKPRTRRECLKQKSSLPNYCESYVINNEKKKGLRLIQVQVLDISEQEPASDNQNVMLSAQYVVTEPVDYVMEETQSLINKISKKLCGDSYY